MKSCLYIRLFFESFLFTQSGKSYSHLLKKTRIQTLGQTNTTTERAHQTQSIGWEKKLYSKQHMYASYIHDDSTKSYNKHILKIVLATDVNVFEKSHRILFVWGWLEYQINIHNTFTKRKHATMMAFIYFMSTSIIFMKVEVIFFPIFFPFRSRKMFIINVCVVCLWLLFIHTYTILLDLATNNKNVSIISVASKWRHIIACVDRCRQSRRNVYDFPPKNLQLHHCSNEYKTNKWFANVVWVSQATIFQITLDESRFLRFRRYPDTNFFAPENKKLLTTTYNRKSLKLKS